MKKGWLDNTKRILVTGSRGKSGITRLLRAGLEAAGFEAWARITGVEPRQLGPGGIQAILRTSGAHVEEMRWWLRQLPPGADAIVLENSAITPELQELAGRWLRPEITVLSNVLPDHQEAWGPTSAGAAEALAAGLPPGGRVVLPVALHSDEYLLSLLKRRRCELLFAEGAEGSDGWQAVNRGLALAALEALGVAGDGVRAAMYGLERDRFDFRVLEHGGAEFAMAFTVNDIASTRSLFGALDWQEPDTRLVYNHRADRPGRLRSFRAWLEQRPWREVLIVGDHPLAWKGAGRYLKLANGNELLHLLRPGDRAFGCGNVAGLPLALY